MGREKRTAAVGRLDDDTPRAQSCDDAVPRQVEVAVLFRLRMQFRDEYAKMWAEYEQAASWKITAATADAAVTKGGEA